MRHSSRKKHLKQVHRNAHVRRISFFRAIQTINNTPIMVAYPNQSQEKSPETVEYEK